MQFKAAGLLRPTEILECYGRMAHRFDNYSKLASGVGRIAKLRGNYDQLERTVKDMDGQSIGKIRPNYPPGKETSFFINEHHRMTCQQLYPQLTHELDREPSEAFRSGPHAPWMPDFDKMVDDFDKMVDACVEHTKLVLAYYRICLAAR